MQPDRIRQAREAAGISQAELARRVGVSAVAVNRWEHGQRTPSEEYLSRIDVALALPAPAPTRGRRGAASAQARAVVVLDGRGLLVSGDQVAVVPVVDARLPLTVENRALLARLAGRAGVTLDADASGLLSAVLLAALPATGEHAEAPGEPGG